MMMYNMRYPKQPFTPQKSNIIRYQKMPFLKGVTFSKAHHFGYPAVSFREGKTWMDGNRDFQHFPIPQNLKFPSSNLDFRWPFYQWMTIKNPGGNYD